MLRSAIREGLEEAQRLREDVPSETMFSPPEYDKQAARAFNDPNAWPNEILAIAEEISKIMRLPDPEHRKSQSGKANPTPYAVAERINTIKRLAKDLNDALQASPITKK